MSEKISLAIKPENGNVVVFEMIYNSMTFLRDLDFFINSFSCRRETELSFVLLLLLIP